MSTVDRLYLTGKTAGVSVLVASLTDSLSLMLGSLTILPALRWFSQFAAICVVFCFVFSITLVIPVIAIDAEYRVKRNRRDCCCCCVVPEAKRKPLNDPKRDYSSFSFARACGSFMCFFLNIDYKKTRTALLKNEEKSRSGKKDSSESGLGSSSDEDRDAEILGRPVTTKTPKTYKRLASIQMDDTDL